MTDYELSRRHRGINYRMCTALDQLKLGMVLDELMAAGMPEREAKLYDQLASVLLAQLRTANNRLHGIDLVESSH